MQSDSTAPNEGEQFPDLSIDQLNALIVYKKQLEQNELMDSVKAKVAECFSVARTIYPHVAFIYPTIRYDLEGRTAGRAFCSPTNPYIRLNWSLLEQNKNDFINRTVPHEVAHIIAYKAYGNAISAHGEIWQLVCRQLGMSDVTRCHSYKTELARKTSKFQHICICGSKHVFGTAVFNKIMSGQNRFCNKCRRSVDSNKIVTIR